MDAAPALYDLRVDETGRRTFSVGGAPWGQITSLRVLATGTHTQYEVQTEYSELQRWYEDASAKLPTELAGAIQRTLDAHKSYAIHQPDARVFVVWTCPLARETMAA